MEEQEGEKILDKEIRNDRLEVRNYIKTQEIGIDLTNNIREIVNLHYKNNFGIKKDEDKNYRTINKFKLKKAENKD